MNAAKLPGIRAQLTYAGRRFHAWWEGYAFDTAAERAAMQAHFQGAGGGPAPADIIAESIWGEGRLEPGVPAWTMRFARMLTLPVRANVVVFGAGAGAPLHDLKHGTRWKVSGLTRAKQFAQGNLRTYDTAMQRLNKAGAAGALSFFELHRDANPGTITSFASELLVPGAKAVFVDFAVPRKTTRLRACFPTAKNGAPKTEEDYRSILKDSGFATAAASDETAEYLSLIEQGWAGWRRAYSAISNIDNARTRAELMRAMAAHAHLWAERFDALKSGQLRVISFHVSRN